jgi:hypothetical protein
MILNQGLKASFNVIDNSCSGGVWGKENESDRE